MLRKISGKFLTAEGQLVKDRSVSFHPQPFQLRRQFPAGGSPDAVGNGQVLSFLSLHIVFKMGIPGKDYVTVKIFGFLNDGGKDLFRLLCAEGSVDKIILHINHKKKFFHGLCLPCSFLEQRHFRVMLPFQDKAVYGLV